MSPTPDGEPPTIAGLVSVVMIFLDGQRFIEEAIASIYDQTYAHWELLLVNDGSRDGSRDIARRVARADPVRVRYLRHPGGLNRGMSASRNLGVANARGQYIAFLDSDDVFLPEKLERTVKILESEPTAAMVFGRTKYWFSWSDQPGVAGSDSLRSLDVGLDRLVRPPELIAAFIDRRAATPATCGVLLRRRAFQRCGGFDERFRGMFEDQVFFHKVCAREPVFVTSEVLDLYRQHPESACYVDGAGDRNVYNRLSESHRVFLEWLEAFLQVECPNDRLSLRTTALRLRPYRHPYLERLRGLRRRAHARLHRALSFGSLRGHAGRARR